MLGHSGRGSETGLYVRFETTQLDFSIYSRADFLVDHGMLQTGNLGHDALGLERSIDNAESDSRQPEPVCRLVHPLCLLWGQIDKLDCISPDDSIIGEVEEVRELSSDSRELLAQRSGSLRGTQCGL